MPMTNFLANQIGNAALTGSTYTGPSSLYTALYSTAPTGNTTGTELVGNGYSRQTITFNSAVDGVCTSNVAVVFTNSTNKWPTIKAFGILDASTSGNLLYYKGINARNVELAGNVTIDSGNVTISFNN